MKTFKTIFGMVFVFLALNSNAQTTSSQNKKDIQKAIQNMVKGKDLQNGKMISDAFWDDIAIFATRGPEILTVSRKQFIDLHETKRFGGHKRNYKIKHLTINDNGIANAIVIAEGDTIYYEYYLGLTKKNGQWKIQTYLQHSEKK